MNAHTCHWPDCKTPVPPKLWGCRAHWYSLPRSLRDEIWLHYAPGQEINGTPSEAYVDVAFRVQEWIKTNGHVALPASPPGKRTPADAARILKAIEGLTNE